MKQKNTILEQQGGYTLANAPQVKPDPKFDFVKPEKTVKQKVKNVVKRTKIAAVGTGEEIERLFSKGLNKDTRKEINEWWLPYYFKTGNFRIKGKNQKSFYVDLRLIGFMDPDVRNYFLKQSKKYNEGITKKRRFTMLNLLAAYMPRTQEAAMNLPKNEFDIKRSHPWRIEATKRLKRDLKSEKSWLERTWKDLKDFPKTFWREVIKGDGVLEFIRKATTKEHAEMNNDDIRKMIQEAFTDKVYGQYPYSHKAGDENEPKEDYIEEWKRFCIGVVQDKSKAKAIAIAKILIKDIELFEDVLDLAGQNQSIGSEILRKMEESTKNMV